MITLNLLHPVELKPVQTWRFDKETVIRIGRSTDNEVVLYSSVVSRYHAELHRQALHWEVVNLGANGTFIDGKPTDRQRVLDGMIIRLAGTGPRLQILLDIDEGLARQQQGDRKEPATGESGRSLGIGTPTYMPIPKDR